MTGERIIKNTLTSDGDPLEDDLPRNRINRNVSFRHLFLLRPYGDQSSAFCWYSMDEFMRKM
jgi:hypothetical protein